MEIRRRAREALRLTVEVCGKLDVAHRGYGEETCRLAEEVSRSLVEMRGELDVACRAPELVEMRLREEEAPWFLGETCGEQAGGRREHGEETDRLETEVFDLSRTGVGSRTLRIVNLPKRRVVEKGGGIVFPRAEVQGAGRCASRV